jgi:D-alanine-D-alanine ligase
MRVAVVFGGRSGEHEVSLVSAASIMRALDPGRYEVIPVGIGKDGRWYTGSGALEYLRNGSGDCAPCILPPDPTLRALLVRNGSSYVEVPVDVVFPIVHGTFGEDGTLQGLLDLADIPYVGSGVMASAMAMDKIMQKILHREAGIPVPEFFWFRQEDWDDQHELVIRDAEEEFGYPVFVKPPNMGSSVGISKAVDRDSLRSAIELALTFDSKVLIEKAVTKAREIEIAVLGNRTAVVSVPGEVLPSNDFYDYDAKYVDGASRLVIPAEVDDEQKAIVEMWALKAFHVLDCEGMARVDFLIDGENGDIYLNEINTIPGFTSISMYPKLFEAAGIPYSELLDRLIDLALQRRTERSGLSRSYTPRADWHRGGEG